MESIPQGNYPLTVGTIFAMLDPVTVGVPDEK